MKSFRVLPLLLFLLFTFAPAASANADSGSLLAYTARMEVRQDGYTSVARIWAADGKLRLSAEGGRAFSSMLADYRQKKAWAFSTALAVYQEFPLASLKDNVPHFFDPGVSFSKKEKIAEENLHGQETVKYEVRTHDPARRDHSGFLWEAKDLPGYPLRWESADGTVLAEWHHARLEEIDRNFFVLPPHFRAQVPPPGEKAMRKPCRTHVQAPGKGP